MSWKQLRDANWHITNTGGWCLKAVQDAFGTDHPYPTAIAAWNANYGGGNHTSVPPLGMTVPIYLTINGVPAGHVAIRLDDGYVASSTLPGTHSQMYIHKNIQDLIDTYTRVYGGMTLLGWSEYVGTVHVVENVPAVVTATAAQVQQDYLDILKRAADADGLHHYTTNGMTNAQVRADLTNSAEHAKLIAAEAAQAAADKAKQAQEAAAAAAAQKAADDKAVAEKAAADAAAEKQAAVAAQEEATAAATSEIQNTVKQNNALLNQLLSIVQTILNKLTSIFK